MNLFGGSVQTTGPEGEPPGVPVSTRPPTPWNRWSPVVVLAALAVVLVLNVVDASLVEQDPVITQPRGLDTPIDILGPTPQDLALTRVVSSGIRKTQTDPVAWAHVTHVRVVSNNVVVQVGTKSKAVVERVCRQARRYMYSPNPYGPKLRHLMIFSNPGRLIIGLDGTDDACVATRLENP